MSIQVSIPEAARFSVFALLGAASSLRADDQTNSPILANLSFDQLSQIKIVSVSQRSEPLANAPAAVHVVTSEDIARSGATSFPEALRNVPGLNVAQINGSAWAIGARGFESQFAAKLLVMEDGVSVYSPLFGGVFWDEQNDFLPDIDQIEVVLGPGGSIWGANAMNGVINIVSKSARDTQGGEIYAGGGTEQAAMTGARYGWQLGTNTYARVYGMYNYTDPNEKLGGGDAHDATSSGRGGFRVDGYPQETTQWTLKGEMRWAENQSYDTVPVVPPPSNIFTNTADGKVFGGQMLGHWQSELNSDSTLQLQAYYDFDQRETAIVNDQIHTTDLLLHHTWTGWWRQTIDWGMEGRMVQMNTHPAWTAYNPASETDWLGSAFAQDEISLVPDKLSLTAGIKLEDHSDIRTLMPQPSVRLTWHPAEKHTIWASWSQALRCPAKNELNQISNIGTLNTKPFPTEYLYLGNPNLDPEKLQAWEIGWRWQARKQLALEVDGYYYQYSKLMYGVMTGTLAPPPAAGDVFTVENMADGHEYGGEASLTWQPSERWFASASYSVRHEVLNPYLPDSLQYANNARNAPNQTVLLSSGLKLCREVELSGALRYLDSIAYYNIPAYFELDARLAWRPNDRWELALVGQNLLHDYHAEYKGGFGVDQSTEIPRGVYAKVTWKF
jgi:iron complex outermembrane receptor protein